MWNFIVLPRPQRQQTVISAEGHGGWQSLYGHKSNKPDVCSKHEHVAAFSIRSYYAVTSGSFNGPPLTDHVSRHDCSFIELWQYFWQFYIITRLVNKGFHFYCVFLGVILSWKPKFGIKLLNWSPPSQWGPWKKLLWNWQQSSSSASKGVRLTVWC